MRFTVTEKQMDAARVEPIVVLLERIAVAMEKMAEWHVGNTETAEKETVPRESTPFPWSEVSTRCKKNLWSFWEMDDIYGDYEWRTKYKWPLSCEDVIEIGFKRLQEARNWGAKSGEEINTILCRMGFTSGREWMST